MKPTVPTKVVQGEGMETKIERTVISDDPDLLIEELEPLIAPGLNFNHNETVVFDQ